MNYLEVKPITPQAGQEYLATGYPGPGVYLLPDGRLAVVYQVPNVQPLCVIALTPPHGLKLVTRVDGGNDQGINVHRLFDQMITLTKS